MPFHLFKQPPAPLIKMDGANPVTINCPVNVLTGPAVNIVGTNPFSISAPVCVEIVDGD